MSLNVHKKLRNITNDDEDLKWYVKKTEPVETKVESDEEEEEK